MPCLCFSMLCLSCMMIHNEPPLPKQLYMHCSKTAVRLRTMSRTLATGVQTLVRTTQPCDINSGWGLSEGLKDELAQVGVPSSLEALITLSIQIDRQLCERRFERSTQQSHPVWMLPKTPVSSNPASRDLVPAAAGVPEPMPLGLIHPSLTPEECQRRRENNFCLYCGKAGYCVLLPSQAT